MFVYVTFRITCEHTWTLVSRLYVELCPRSCRYGISLQVWFNSIAHEWDGELNTRREISYLQATMYYFVYHINTMALYWQEKSTLLMNENERIDNPNKDCKGRYRTQDENMRWVTTKTNNGPNFHYTVNELVVTDRRNLSGTRPKSACLNYAPRNIWTTQPSNCPWKCWWNEKLWKDWKTSKSDGMNCWNYKSIPKTCVKKTTNSDS